MGINAYTLYGTLKGDTKSFQDAMRGAHVTLQGTKTAIDAVEGRAVSLGKTSAATAREFERLRERVAAAHERLQVTAEAFRRGEASATQMRAALLGAERAAAQLNSRLADSNAKLSDFQHKTAGVKASLQSMSDGIKSAGMALTAGFTAPLLALGAASIKSASGIDALENKLTAATGSVDGAKKKIAELRALAQSNAGVFANSAADIFAYFKAMKVGDATINDLIKALGRLSLANENLDIKEFSRNLTQLFDQDFEMQDLKQAIGVFPQFGQIAQKAFGLAGSSLDEVKAGLQELVATGRLTREEFFRLFAQAVQGDAVFSKLSDTVGIRFAKMLERVQIALQPLGQTILTALEPIVNAIVPMIQRLGEWFASLSPQIQTAIVAFLGLAAALGPVLLVIGSVIGAIITIGGAIASAVAAVGGLTVALPILAGFVLFLGEIAAASYVLYRAWTENWGGIQEVTMQVWDVLKAGASALMDQLKLAFELGLRIIHGDWSGAWDTFLKIVEEHTRFIVAAMNAILPKLGEWGLALFKILGEWAIKAIAFVVNAFINLPKYLIELVPMLINAGLQLGGAIRKGVIQGLAGGGGGDSVSATPTFDSLLQQLKDTLGFDKLSEIFKGASTQVTNDIKSVKTAATTANRTIAEQTASLVGDKKVKKAAVVKPPKEDKSLIRAAQQEAKRAAEIQSQMRQAEMSAEKQRMIDYYNFQVREFNRTSNSTNPDVFRMFELRRRMIEDMDRKMEEQKKEDKINQLEITLKDESGKVNGVKTPTPDDVKITYGTYGTAGGLSSF